MNKFRIISKVLLEGQCKARSKKQIFFQDNFVVYA
jgi:hypothetical protein